MSVESLSSRILGSLLSPYQQERLQSIGSQFRSNPKGIIGLGIVGGLIIIAIFAPILAPYDPNAIDSTAITEAPSSEHIFGTDKFGRDIFSRILMGARISLYVGLLSVGIALAIGVPLGTISAYYGGFTDEFIMRLMDAMMSFPGILLALVVMAVLGPNLTNVLIALGFVYTPYFARISRSATLSEINEEYVDAARARGERNPYIIFREVLPNITAPVIVQASITFAFAILAEAALSFLGMGTQPPTPSWGLMINGGRGYMADAPWMVVFPGLAIGFTVLGYNMLGDAMRDILDPKEESIGGGE